jgi:site-specific recombinase XerD
MAVFGHSQISATMDLYTHMMPSTMRDVATRMDTLLSGTE